MEGGIREGGGRKEKRRDREAEGMKKRKVGRIRGRGEYKEGEGRRGA